jgi:sulfate transport system ATP-binding protein
VFVTHDQEEALELADRVAVLNAGRLEQLGTPAEVYDAPATPFVAEFLGDAVRVPVRAGLLRHVAGDRDNLVVLVRPHDIEVAAPGGPDSPGVPATVRRAVSRGAARLLELELDDGTRLEAEVARADGRADGLAPGAKVQVHARVAHRFGAAE